MTKLPLAPLLKIITKEKKIKNEAIERHNYMPDPVAKAVIYLLLSSLSTMKVITSS
jgi:hypothetical protein